ncbi:uncharacterized protein LOC119988160 [Tripterygium wilfordii]|uniref:uncharacterized protein LOC119988160 n=1 Tax=Tripterygium wilfordii TaxID=458696 RepID=UPI0018F80069|nr:uncharacterized protein LOC119988160 [Tripterygium wilfordii]
MPQELPGFYYDAEKNRYFPIKGPIPGSSRSSSSTTRKEPTEATNICRSVAVKISKLLQFREVNGNVVAFNKRKLNVKEEIHKIQASEPVVHKYRGTDRVGESALEQIRLAVCTPEGQTEMDVLLAGSVNGSVSCYEVGNVGQFFDNGVVCTPDLVRPHNRENKVKRSKDCLHILRSAGLPIQMSSGISSIKLSSKQSPSNVDGGSNSQFALVSTLGSEKSGGSVYVLDLSEPLDFRQFLPIIWRRIHDVASFDCTIWTSDCNSNASKAVIGTNLGAALVNLESGASSWVCRCSSDVLAQQFHNSENVVLCGLRNGAILTVDVREKQAGESSRLVRQRIPYSRTNQNSNRRWFEVKGNICASHTTYMPSSITSLVSLQLYDQYFLASSMDGSIKLYDHRLTKRGGVQSYEGNVNSHTHLQLGVDPSERFILSGGEDCKVKLWSLKSGELLFDDKFSNSVCSTICWQRSEKCRGLLNEAWLGSKEGLFNMHWF